jgi:Golgi phosphoprotein 3 (GPP34)
MNWFTPQGSGHPDRRGEVPADPLASQPEPPPRPPDPPPRPPDPPPGPPRAWTGPPAPARQPWAPPQGPAPPANPAASTQRRFGPHPPDGQRAGIRIVRDLFLIAHGASDGKPLLPPRVMGMAIAGGMLCELALLGYVGIRRDTLIVADRPPPAEELAQSVLRQLLGQPDPLPVRDWITYLASGSTAAVGDQLTRAGVVRASRRLRAWRYVPVDSTNAFFTAGRLAVMLEDGVRRFSLPEATLIGLVDAAGLIEHLPTVKPAANRGRAAAVVQSLTWPLDGLVAETSGVIENAILTGRT